MGENVFSKKLREIRVIERMSQADFTEKLNLQLSAFKTWETGRCIPSFEKYNVLISALKTADIDRNKIYELEECYTAAKSRN